MDIKVKMVSFQIIQNVNTYCEIYSTYCTLFQINVTKKSIGGSKIKFTKLESYFSAKHFVKSYSGYIF